MMGKRIGSKRTDPLPAGAGVRLLEYPFLYYTFKS